MTYRTLFRSDQAQASIESAFILPLVFICMGLALQPLLYMYSKSLCTEAVEEGARYAISVENDTYVERYVRRRLDAIPSIGILHKDGDGDWNIEIVRQSNSVAISLTGHMQELPILGLAAHLYLPHDAEGLLIEAKAQAVSHPSWREGSYEDWVEPYR